jgi:hypothetical protein
MSLIMIARKQKKNKKRFYAISESSNSAVRQIPEMRHEIRGQKLCDKEFWRATSIVYTAGTQIKVGAVSLSKGGLVVVRQCLGREDTFRY